MASKTDSQKVGEKAGMDEKPKKVNLRKICIELREALHNDAHVWLKKQGLSSSLVQVRLTVFKNGCRDCFPESTSMITITSGNQISLHPMERENYMDRVVEFLYWFVHTNNNKVKIRVIQTIDGDANAVNVVTVYPYLERSPESPTVP